MTAALLLLAAAAGDWQPLFDPVPRDVTGWRVEGEVIHALRSSPLLTADLYSGDRFSDFELEVEYRVSDGGNSGIRYLPLPGHVAGLGRAAAVCSAGALLVLAVLRRRRWLASAAALILLAPIPLLWAYLSRHPLALEFQVLDNERHRDGKRGPLYRAGALYGLSPAGEEPSRPAGEWNQARVSVCGTRIRHWLNGTLVVDVDMVSAEHARSREGFYRQGLYRVFGESEWRRLGWERPSRVGLQHHGEEVWFRNARVREGACEGAKPTP